MRPRRSTMIRFAIADVLLCYLVWRLWTARKGSKWQPSPRRHTRRILEMAQLQPGEILYDLGSGDGRVVIGAARSFGAEAVGIEIDPIRRAISRVRARFSEVAGLTRFVGGNLFESDLTDADVVVVFLSQQANDELEAKLLEELPPGARVISSQHTFENLRLVDEDVELSIRVYAVG